MKALVLVVAACAALAAAAPAGAAGRTTERGIVQSVGPGSVVLRALDGTAVTVAVGPATRVRLNGRPAPLSAVRQGFVAEAVSLGTGDVLVLRAFGRPAPTVERGVVVRAGPRALVLRRASGVTTRVPLAARTAVRRAGVGVGTRSVRAGMRVAVVLAPNGAARVVRILGEGR